MRLYQYIISKILVGNDIYESYKGFVMVEWILY